MWNPYKRIVSVIVGLYEENKARLSLDANYPV